MEPLSITDEDGDPMTVLDNPDGVLVVLGGENLPSVLLSPADASKLRDWLSTYLAHQESNRAHE